MLVLLHALIPCLAAYILPSSPVLLHINCTCFSTFWHYHPYILQHFNGNVFFPDLCTHSTQGYEFTQSHMLSHDMCMTILRMRCNSHSSVCTIKFGSGGIVCKQTVNTILQYYCICTCTVYVHCGFLSQYTLYSVAV